MPRKPCSDDPVLWNELHSQRTSSLVGRVVALVGQLVAIWVLAIGTSWFALPAFAELSERGYGAARAGFTIPEVNPLARVLIGKLLIPAGSFSPGQARLEFNMALRQFSSLFVMLYVVMVCGTAAVSMIVERERNTWQSLVATTLTPWEILRAKMLAAIWRARAAGLTLIALWTVGLLAGALHPIGFVNAIAGLIAIGALYAAVGVSMGLQVGHRKQIDSTDHLLRSVRAPLERAGDPVAGLVDRFPGGMLESLSHLVVAVLVRGCASRCPLRRASATGRVELQTRRDRSRDSGGLLVCRDCARGRSLRPFALNVPEI